MYKRQHLNTLKLVPRRLLWGVGLAVLAVALIIIGVKGFHKPVGPPQPATVAAPVALPPVGAGPPLAETGESGAPREPVPAAKPAPGQPPAPATPAAKDQRYLVVVATYPTMKQAEVLQQRLRAKQFKAAIITRQVGGKPQYQVQVGPLTGARAAEDAASRIKTQEKITPKVVKLAPKTANANNVRRPSR